MNFPRRAALLVAAALLLLLPPAATSEPAAPDLTGELGRVGDTFEATVRNVGGADAGPFVVRIFFDGELLQESRLTGAVAGRAYEFGVDFWGDVIPHGVHNLTLVVDADASVAETDEANNVAALPFHYPFENDLSTTILSLEPAPRGSTAPHTVRYRACNEDARRLFDDVIVYFNAWTDAGDRRSVWLMPDVVAVDLAPGACVDGTRQFELPRFVGWYRLEVRAYADNYYDLTDEDNLATADSYAYLDLPVGVASPVGVPTLAAS